MSPVILTRRQTFLRWLGLLSVTVVAGFVVRRQVASPAEMFWCLFPVWLLAGSWGLRLFPVPRLAARTRATRVAIIGILIAFPILFYGGLTWLTNSAWSWTELALCVYFFGFALECFLLVFFAAFSSLERCLERHLAPRWRLAAVAVQKVTMYAMLVPLLLVIFAVHRPKLIPRPLAGAVGQVVEEIRFPARDGLSLRGIFLPLKKARGTVIVCHGVGANHADIQPLFLQLYSVGFQILAFDFRGHGNSAGHTVTYGLQERGDVLGAYDYCLTRRDIDPSRLFALGVSMGGGSLLQALPEMPRVRAAVVDSAFASLERMAGHQLRFFPGLVRGPLVQLMRGVAWLETGGDIRSLSPADRLREIPIPLLIIHGTADTVVPVEHAHLLHAAATGPVQLVIEPGAPHIGAVGFDPAGYVERVTHHFLSATDQDLRAVVAPD